MDERCAGWEVGKCPELAQVIEKVCDVCAYKFVAQSAAEMEEVENERERFAGANRRALCVCQCMRLHTAVGEQGTSQCGRFAADNPINALLGDD